MNFWNRIKKPIIGVSPMDGITDAAFRFIIANTSNPDVIFTEFVNADGIIKGSEKVLYSLYYNEGERPIVAQLFGKNPEMFKLASMAISELGFDGIDINMGCPSKSVSGHGAGAGLIKTPELAKEIILATREGVNEWLKTGTKSLPEKVVTKISNFKKRLVEQGVEIKKLSTPIPVSVKTRIGFGENDIENWTNSLMDVKPNNVTIHGRTYKEMYKGEADWEAIRNAGLIIRERSDIQNPTTILGNGDVKSYSDAIEKSKKYELDGVLVGRALFGNPWFFSLKTKYKDNKVVVPFNEIKDKIIEQVYRYSKIYGNKSIYCQRKHMAWYISGIDNAASLRQKLMQVTKPEDVEKIMADVLTK